MDPKKGLPEKKKRKTKVAHLRFEESGESKYFLKRVLLDGVSTKKMRAAWEGLLQRDGLGDRERRRRQNLNIYAHLITALHACVVIASISFSRSFLSFYNNGHRIGYPLVWKKKKKTLNKQTYQEGCLGAHINEDHLKVLFHGGPNVLKNGLSLRKCKEIQ